MSVPVVQENGKAPNRGSLLELEGRAAEKYKQRRLKMEHGYMTADTKVWDYMRYPAFLNNEQISNASKLLYMYLLERMLRDRTEEEHGFLYTEFPVMEQMRVLSRSSTTVQPSLLELEQARLLERRHPGVGRNTRLYVLY